MVETENKVIQCRRDTAANWASNNPVPKAGEWCFETDTGVTKIGDGATNYNSLAAVGKTDATKAELDKLHNLSTTKTELGYVHGVTSAIQTQLNAKFAKADIQTSFGETLSDEKVASEKLVKNSLDAKQDGITVANNSMLKASVLSAMNIVGENNSGRRYDEPKTLAKVISAAHSTFDLSKFTVVGSPNITADGVVLSTSTNNYFYVTDFNNPLPNKISFNFRMTIPNVLPATHTHTAFALLNSEDSNFRIYVRLDNNTSNLVFGYKNSSNTYSNKIMVNLVPNTIFNINIDVNGANIAFKVNDEVFHSGNNLKIDTNVRRLWFGSGINNSYYWENFDLKTVNYSIDGVPVFSGNKTGIDTIKPDDYTVVGTPTISADGVVTSAGRVNHFTLSDYDYSKPFQVKFRWNKSNDARNIILAFNSIDTSLRASTPANNKYAITFYLNGTSVLQETGHLIFDINTTYDILFNWTGTVYSLYYKLPQDEQYTLVTSATNSTAITTNDASSLLGITGQYQDFTGKFDLNSFKIYANGNLVYQPCLKIPYTLAANDKKFINPIYENRAKDMAEQFGVAPYYILDEDNGNFAMPYGSVEEKVAPKIVVGHYEDGTSAWEQYLDRTMIQRGTMVADTDVTFPCSDEYADTNFTLSCPFSAKTTSGFTPSASGTYIAVGKF